MKKALAICLLTLFSFANIYAQTSVSEVSNTYIGKYLEYIKDTVDLSIRQVVNQENFTKIKDEVPNLGLSKFPFWLRFQIKNDTDREDWKLYLGYPILDDVYYYLLREDGSIDSVHYAEHLPISKREYFKSDYIFNLDLAKGEKAWVYLKVQTSEQLILPLELRDTLSLWTKLNSNSLFNGLYGGIIFIMLIYNLFLYYTVRDSSYIYYVFYLLFIGLTQLGIKGVTHEYLWPDLNFIKPISIHIFGALGAMFGVLFTKDFLHTKTEAPQINNFLNILVIGFLSSILISVMGYDKLAFTLMQTLTSLSALLILLVAILLVSRGYRSAKFFLVAWSALLAGAVVFLLKDFGIFPYNVWTNYSVQVSSALEVVLLSFALADKINILKREKEESQARELVASQENQRIIKEQNMMLEAKVKERTKDLEAAKQKVEQTLKDLQNAQTQLVSAEKMASLGQLTAGIAHEINNPINFVTSNILPLTQDIEDLKMVLKKYEELCESEKIKGDAEAINALKKQIDFEFTNREIDDLLKGISEGAKRTAEIVKGLRNFSRLDESEFKTADIHEGLNSTLIILRSSFKENIRVECVFDEEIPKFECYPGKLNQVFANLISNSVQAIQEHLNTIVEPKITIKTINLPDHVQIVFEDNGPGIPKEIQDKVFDPFFTTKEVGEGTGLGLSIVYSIIETHKGKLELHSSPGEGTKFVITLPKKIET